MKKLLKLSPSKIIHIIEANKDELRKYGVKRIALFGSFLKKTDHPKSDIDFLVVFDHPTFDNYMELKFFLEKLFQRKVDIVVEENLKPALKYIKEEALYARY
mgnify:FL=1